MKWFDNTALTIVIIGAVNWLLVGIFRFDLVAFLFGNLSWFCLLYTSNPCGYIVMPGCQVPIGTPLENIDALRYAVREYSKGAVKGKRINPFQ